MASPTVNTCPHGVQHPLDSRYLGEASGPFPALAAKAVVIKDSRDCPDCWKERAVKLARRVIAMGEGDAGQLQALLIRLGEWPAHVEAVKLADEVLELTL